MAIEDFSKAISLNPNDPGAYADRAKAYAAKGEIKKTADDLRKLKERWPDYPLNE
jgi:tetratricopeptide (TPR) repeat protein